MYNVEDLLYAAGFFDGEGCISVGRSTFGKCWPFIWISVTNTNQEVIIWFQTRFGGHTYDLGKDKRRPNGKDLFTWKKNGKDAYDFLNILHPHLKVKRYEALLAIALHLNLPAAGKEDWEQVQDLANRLCNYKGKRHKIS